MVERAIKKTFDPVTHRAKEVIASNRDSFTYGREQALLSTFYYVLLEAQEKNMANGDYAYRTLLPDHMKPRAQVGGTNAFTKEQTDSMEASRTAQKERLLNNLNDDARNKIISILQQSELGQKRDYSSAPDDTLVLHYFKFRLDPGAQAIDYNSNMAPIYGFIDTTIEASRDSDYLVIQVEGGAPIQTPWSTSPSGFRGKQHTGDFSVDYASPSLLEAGIRDQQRKDVESVEQFLHWADTCLLYTSPSPRD